MSLAAPPEPEAPATDADCAAFDLVGDWAAPPDAVALEPYFYDPVAFARECIRWPDNHELTEHQAEGLKAIIDFFRVCIRSMHGAGKTTFCAIFILWFALTRDAMCATGEYGITDWKIVTTAGAWRQLERYLWPEVHKWATRLDWEKIGRKPFTKTELQRLTLRLTHGEASSAASDNPALIEGAHADAIAYLFDESKAIAEATFDAAEGAFSGEGSNTLEAFALAVSTPGEPLGRFYDIQIQKKGLDVWKALHWTLEKVMKSGRITQEFVDRHKLMWGEKSALFANRVLGEFHSADEDSVIPLAWVQAAIDRWKDRVVPDSTTDPFGYIEALGAMDLVSVDVARFGSDESVLGLKFGHRIEELRPFFHNDTMETAGLTVGVLNAHPGSYATIDTDGLGAGVTDRVREQGYDVEAFHAGESTDEIDRSGELGFVNVRSAAWWKLRENLDPATDPEIELPPDDKMLGDLCAPKWKVLSNGRIAVESKDDIKKRLGRSTDHGDTVVMAFWERAPRRRARMTWGPETDEEAA